MTGSTCWSSAPLGTAFSLHLLCFTVRSSRFAFCALQQLHPTPSRPQAESKGNGLKWSCRPLFCTPWVSTRRGVTGQRPATSTWRASGKDHNVGGVFGAPVPGRSSALCFYFLLTLSTDMTFWCLQTPHFVDKETGSLVSGSRAGSGPRPGFRQCHREAGPFSAGWLTENTELCSTGFQEGNLGTFFLA